MKRSATNDDAPAKRVNAVRDHVVAETALVLPGRGGSAASAERSFLTPWNKMSVRNDPASL